MRLNIGGGKVGIPGFVNVDRINGDEAYPLKYADNVAEEIRASHILEHFSFEDSGKALADWHRVLKPGGRIRISVPDVNKVLEAMESDGLWARYLMGGQTDKNDFHLSCWTAQRLKRALRKAGFDNLSIWKSDGKDTSCHKVSLNIEGHKNKKEEMAEYEEIKIVAAMSLPRLGWNDNWGCVVDALRPLKIPVRRYTGAFWGQCLQNVFEDLVADGIDWVLCIDYDSMFTAEDVDSLLGCLGSNPEIDAVAALQSKRNNDTPLMSIKDTHKVEATGAPIKVDSAHFGLTLIRVDAIADLPKPWFQGKPGPDGTWTHSERLDPDIWFWHQFRLTGKSVYVDTNCRIGHLELMVSGFDNNMEYEQITTKEWYKRKGKI